MEKKQIYQKPLIELIKVFPLAVIASSLLDPAYESSIVDYFYEDYPEE